MMSKRGLKKFDTSLLTNDGGKYSPSIRRLRQHYFPEKIFSPSITKQINEFHHQSSIDLISTSFKCNDCQKNDGLFQCCHCNQRLCIRCCNKHYKKVTNELEHLQDLSNQLLTKIFHIKTNLEKQKNQLIEQCHQWRIDTINKINQAHTLIIQTIHDEDEILGKEYEKFVENEMTDINIDQNQLIKMKKGNLGSLISSSLTTIRNDSKKSIDIIKQRIESFAKRIDHLGKFSFQVKLPNFDMDDNLKVQSSFGDMTRNTSVLWQNEDSIHDIPSTESKKESSTSIDKDTELQSNHHDSAYGTASSSSTNSLSNPTEDHVPKSTNLFNRRHTYTYDQTSSNDHEDTYQSIQQNSSLNAAPIQIESNQKNDKIIQQHEACKIQRGTTDLPNQPSPLDTDRLPNSYSWLSYRTHSTPSFIQ